MCGLYQVGYNIDLDEVLAEVLADRPGEEKLLPPASSSPPRRSRRTRRAPNRLLGGREVIVVDPEATDLEEGAKKKQADKDKKQKKKKKKKQKKKDKGSTQDPSIAAKRKSATPSVQKKQKKAKKSPSAPGLQLPEGVQCLETDDADVVELPGHPGWWIIPGFGTREASFIPGDRFCLQQVTTHDFYRFTIHNLFTICSQFVNNL